MTTNTEASQPVVEPTAGDENIQVGQTDSATQFNKWLPWFIGGGY